MKQNVNQGNLGTEYDKVQINIFASKKTCTCLVIL